MSRFLFVTWDGGGNVPPTLGIAAELAQRGHDVTIIGDATQAETIAARGLAFVPFGSTRHFDASRYTNMGAFFALTNRAKGREIVTHLKSQPADIVIVDCMLYGVMDVLARNGIDYVVLEHLFDHYLRAMIRGPFGIAASLYGIRTTKLLQHATMRLAASLPELDPPSPGVTHIGPIVKGTPAHPTEPTVLISLSTVGYPDLADTWRRVLGAVDGLQARVLATTGPAIDPAELNPPANVELHRWLPHNEVLPASSLVVGHGGHATTMVALAHNLPVLVLPVHSMTDQPAVGRAVANSGAGATMSRRSSPAQIRAAIDVLLSSSTHRERAAHLGARICATDARQTGANHLEAAASS